MPVDADVPETRKIVVPADRSGVVLDFGVSKAADAALVSLVDRKGTPIAVGAKGRVEGSDEEFVIGYDGEAYIRTLHRQNAVAIELPDGSSCRAEFAYRAVPGQQVIIKQVICF